MTVKAIAAFFGDVLVCSVAIAWCWLGLWINLFGFSIYHSRGNVWLPTPPAAIVFFHSMVMSGTLGFALSVLVASSATLLLESRHATVGRSVYTAFYGDARRLSTKYLAFLLSAFVSPFFYDFMWRFRGTRSFRIACGLALTLVAFTIILIAGEALVAVAMPDEPSTPPNHR